MSAVKTSVKATYQCSGKQEEARLGIQRMSLCGEEVAGCGKEGSIMVSTR